LFSGKVGWIWWGIDVQLGQGYAATWGDCNDMLLTMGYVVVQEEALRRQDIFAQRLPRTTFMVLKTCICCVKRAWWPIVRHRLGKGW